MISFYFAYWYILASSSFYVNSDERNFFIIFYNKQMPLEFDIIWDFDLGQIYIAPFYWTITNF